MNNNTIKIIGFLVLAALAVGNIIQCSGAKKIKAETEENIGFKEKYNSLLIDFDTLVNAYSRMRDFSPKGDTIEMPGDDWVNRVIFENSWKRLQDQLAANAKLKSQLEKAEIANAELARLTQEQFEMLGGVFTEQVPVEEALPIVETVGRDSGEYFTLHSIIHSRGDLIYKKFDVKVKPQILKVNVPEISIQDNTKKNFLGLQAGAISQNNIDLNELQIPVSILYINKNFGASGGVILDNQFKGIQGFQASLIAGIKW